MNDLGDGVVRVAIAHHLGVEADAIDDDAELERDLGLDAFDLVLIVLRLEELTGDAIAIADLESVSTVGDLHELALGSQRDTLVDDRRISSVSW
jgi:acyl carrier protein